MKTKILLLTTFLLTGCAGMSWTTLDTYAVTALSTIKSATAAAIATGALPKGNTANILNDVNTVSAGLETILTGQPLTTDQAKTVAASFKSNSSTSSYITAATPIVNALVTAVNGAINAGATPSQATATGVQVLVNAPAAVQAGLGTPTLPSSTLVPGRDDGGLVAVIR